MSLAAVILAAGKGTRMRSRLPKALHPVCGKPMTQFLIERAKEAGSKKTVVVAGYGVDEVRASLPSAKVVLQKEQLGSGHAVQQAARALSGFSGSVLVLYCDTPLITTATLKKLLEDHRANGTDCTMLTVDVADPAGYGRIRRNADGSVDAIIEHVNATDEEKRIREINVGCYVFKSKALFAALKRVPKDPVKKEYYLTDVIAMLSSEGLVHAIKTPDQDEVRGVNTRVDLAGVQEIMQRRILEAWMLKGVGVRDPKTTFIDSDVEIGQDTVLLPHTVIEEGTRIGERCTIGPFARIRGASRIGSESVIGNFVEIMRSKVGRHTQIKHLSYLGDAEVGDHVNVGAGTITANFDGKNKHKTVIRDRASTGSGTVLVAPVVMGRGSRTGAGAVVTKGTRVKDGAVFVGVPAKELKRKKK